MKETFKKIGNVILDILVILVLVISLMVVVLSATSKKSGVSNLFGYTVLSVQTDSMEPKIMVGDFIIGRVSAEDAEYEIGDVVTFKTIVNSTYIFNTHRIIEKNYVEGAYQYVTKGDNSPAQDDGYITSYDIVSVWEGTRIPFLGKVVDFLKSGVGFVIFLLVPVIIFFLFYLYKFIKNLILYNKEVAAEAAVEAAKAAQENAPETSEEQKQKIIQEYLASIQQGKDAQDPKDNES